MTNDTRDGELGTVGKEAELNKGVGLVAPGGDSGSLIRAIMRATERDYEVFVVSDGRGDDEEALRFACRLGATIVKTGGTSPSEALLRQRLGIAARKHGCSKLIVNLDTTKRIDYNRSEALLDQEEFLAEAATADGNADTVAPLEVLVAIPAYNESGTIASIVEHTLTVADEVLVIDDGSADDTAARAEAAGASVVAHNRNKGYGAAIQTAFKEAKTRDVQHLVLIDADGQHDPSDIPRLVQMQQESGAELVIGSRFTDGGRTDAPLYRRIGLGIVNVLTNISLGAVRSPSYVHDTQSGFRAFNQPAIESLVKSKKIGNGMSASTDIIYHMHASGFEIEEMGTTISYDVESASSHRPLEHGMTLVENILQTIERQRPMTVLGVPGFLSALAGLGIAYWSISIFVRSGTFPVGASVISSVFILVGIFTCFTGIILHALNTQVVHHLE